MLELLILTVALGASSDGVHHVHVAGLVAAPVEFLLERKPARRLAAAPVKFFANRKPARKMAARVAGRIRQRPMLARRLLFPQSR